MKVDITKDFEKVYAEQSDSIFRFCLIRVSDREQALDITQEVFVRLWQSFLEEKDIKNSRAFLFTVARNLIIDWYRKKKSISLDEITESNDEGGGYDFPDEKTIDGLEFKAEGRYLIRVLKELDSSYREPLYLRFIEGLSPKEIGKILDISANAASVRVNRGLLELRKKTGYNSDGDFK